MKLEVGGQAYMAPLSRLPALSLRLAPSRSPQVDITGGAGCPRGRINTRRVGQGCYGLYGALCTASRTLGRVVIELLAGLSKGSVTWTLTVYIELGVR